MNKPTRIKLNYKVDPLMQSKSPDGRPVVSVCRPGKWGNEFRVEVDTELWFVLDASDNVWGKPHGYENHDDAAACAKRLYANGWLEGKVGIGELNPFELHGKHLACTCRLDSPCHADVLLEWANEPRLLWHRYDYLMRKQAEHTRPEKAELVKLRALLGDAGIVVDSDIF